MLQQYADLHSVLVQNGVRVHLFTHEQYHETPDAVFPNNWITTHAAVGSKSEPTLVLYPMKAASRRRERRNSIIRYLSSFYTNQINMTVAEYGSNPHFLEGTGSLALDRKNQVAYVLLSERSHEVAVRDWKANMPEYDVVPSMTRVDHQVLFHAFYKEGAPIYHTNKALFVGQSFAVLCAEAITDAKERAEVVNSLKSHGKEIVTITLEQVKQFCANILELSSENGESLLVMSTTAHDGFSEDQRKVLRRNVDKVLTANISFIEHIGGSSVRGTIAELF